MPRENFTVDIVVIYRNGWTYQLPILMQVERYLLMEFIQKHNIADYFEVSFSFCR